jgi:4-azaleucine resistance transporter AzlC
MTRHEQGGFRLGLLATLPVAVSYVPIGLLFGALAAAKGMTAPEILAMSLLVYSGATQLVAIELWREPLPTFALAVTALSLSLRHVMMGTSLARHLGAFSPLQRWIGAFFMTDETWALAERKAAERRLSPGYYFGLALPLYLTWASSSLAGAYLGALVSDPAVYGVDFAFSAIFLALIAGFWKGARTGVVVVASAGAAVAAWLLVPGVWYVIAGGLAGMVAAAAMAAIRPETADAT